MVSASNRHESTRSLTRTANSKWRCLFKLIGIALQFSTALILTLLLQHSLEHHKTHLKAKQCILKISGSQCRFTKKRNQKKHPPNASSIQAATFIVFSFPDPLAGSCFEAAQCSTFSVSEFTSNLHLDTSRASKMGQYYCLTITLKRKDEKNGTHTHKQDLS